MWKLIQILHSWYIYTRMLDIREPPAEETPFHSPPCMRCDSPALNEVPSSAFWGGGEGGGCGGKSPLAMHGS